MGGFPALAIQQPPSVLDQYTRVAQLRSLAGAQQLQQLQIEEQQRQQRSQKAIMDSYVQNKGNIDEILKNPSSDIIPEHLMALQQHSLTLQTQVAKLKSDQLANVTKSYGLIGNEAANMLPLSDDERRAALPKSYARLVNAGAMTQDQANQELTQTGQMNPAQLTQYLQMHQYQAEDVKTRIEQEQKDRETSAQETKAQAEAWKPNASGGFTNVLSGEERDAHFSPTGVVGKGLPEQEARSWLQLHPGSTLSDYEKYKATLVPAFNFNLQQGTPLTQTALDMQAEKYFSTGQLPPIGRGTAGAVQNRKIINRAAELHPGESLAAGSAEYAANKKSLENITNLFNSVSAFENTAIKNLDQVAITGAKVPELGARFLNTPVRAISSNVLGTPEMAQFRTALLTAQTEAARVLNTANASGVLSDEARKEAQKVLDGNLPYKSMVASINQLKTDFANRHQSYADQIAAIKGRLGGQAAPETPTTPAAKAFIVPQGAPAPPKEDGHKLKMNGQVVAISKGGQWVAP